MNLSAGYKSFFNIQIFWYFFLWLNVVCLYRSSLISESAQHIVYMR